MATNNFGGTYRELRQAKGYDLRAAAGTEVSIQFLSQFERGQSQISFERLVALLRNIHVTLSEFVAAAGNDHLNWLDWWAYQLNAAWRQHSATPDGAVAMAPASVQPVVRSINQLVMRAPDQQRQILTGADVTVLASVIRRTPQPTIFSNMVASLGAFVLPESVRTLAVIQLLDHPLVWTYARYLRPGTTLYALICVAEAEAVFGNAQRAQSWLDTAGDLLLPSDTYERLRMRMVGAELQAVRGEMAASMHTRAQVLRSWQLLDDGTEYRLAAGHMDRVWSVIGGVQNGTA